MCVTMHNLLLCDILYTHDIILPTVVVIGFEENAYVVFEGQVMDVCIAVLDRELSNDEDRIFTVATSQLTNDAATGKYPI